MCSSVARPSSGAWDRLVPPLRVPKSEGSVEVDDSMRIAEDDGCGDELDIFLMEDQVRNQLQNLSEQDPHAEESQGQCRVFW